MARPSLHLLDAVVAMRSESRAAPRREPLHCDGNFLVLPGSSSKCLFWSTNTNTNYRTRYNFPMSKSSMAIGSGICPIELFHRA